MTGGDLLARILRDEGVRQAFCFSLGLIMEALSRNGVRVITTRQKRAAGNRADGVSCSTNGRQIGTETVQMLAGAENAFAGIAHSYSDSTPILFLPGHPGIEQIDRRPTFDSVANYRSATKKLATRILSVVGDQPVWICRDVASLAFARAARALTVETIA